MAKKDKLPPAAALAENQFEYGGKKYRVLLGKMRIAELGELTAADVCASPEAQEYLVKANCLGSVLEEVIE